MYSIIQRIFKYVFTIPMFPIFVFIFGMGIIFNNIISFMANPSYDGFKHDVVYGPYGWNVFVDFLKVMYC